MTSIVLLRRVRDQRQLPCPHDGGAQLALMQRAGARDAAWQDLGALGNERHQQLDVLVVDVVDLVRAELADLATAEHRPALLAILALRGRTAAATPGRFTWRHYSSLPMSKRSSRSSSLSPRWPSPG